MEIVEETLMDQLFDWRVVELLLQRKAVDSQRRERLFLYQTTNMVLQTITTVTLKWNQFQERKSDIIIYTLLLKGGKVCCQ